jgi:sigma-B regulation protein RsbU (phosphoserine phosphatase)
MKNRNLAFKLSVSILSVTAVIFTLVFLYNYYISRELILKNVQENTRNLTSSAINKSEGFFRSIEKVAFNFSFVAKDDMGNREHLKKLIREIVGNNEEIFGSCVAYAPEVKRGDTMYFAPYFCRSGDSLLYRDLADTNYFYPAWDWYRVPAKSKNSVWSEPYFDEGGGNEIMSTYSVPFYRGDSSAASFMGVITADVSLAWLSDIISHIKIFKTGYAFLISRKGVIITHPEEAYIMTESIFSLADTFHDEGLRKIGNDMVAGKEDFVKLEPGFFKETSWVYYTCLDNNNWSLAFVFPESELYADLHALNYRLVLIAAAGLLILLTLIMLIARRITRPVRKLVLATREIGHGNFDMAIAERPSHDEVGLLQSSFIQMQTELRTYIANLNEATSAREKVESELKIAREIQMGMIPRTFPAFPQHHELDMFGFIEPARSVGGDFFDLFFIDKDHLFFVIGDVSGKGIPAAMFMAVTLTALRAGTRVSGNKLDDVMMFTSDHLVENNPQNFFVTTFAGVLNIVDGTMRFVNFGHNPPYVLRKNGDVKRVEALSGLPLGIRKMAVVAPFELKLEIGDALVMYTDGITEAFDSKSVIYGDSRLNAILHQAKGSACRHIVGSLVGDVKSFSKGHDQDDDIAVLTFRYQGSQEGKRQQKVVIEIPNDLNSLHQVQEAIHSAYDGVYSKLCCGRLELVLEELITNTIKYGYKGSDTHFIRIEMQGTNDGIEVLVIDDAETFDPVKGHEEGLASERRDDVPGGRGLLLVNSLATRLLHSHTDGENRLSFLITD